MRTGRSYSSTNGSSSLRIPLCPSSSNFHVVSTSVARAVVMATPVTTMLGKPFPVANDDDVDIGLANVPFLLVGSVPPEDQRDVVSAKAERVVDGVLVVAITWLARDDVEVDLGIRRVIVKCRWY